MGATDDILTHFDGVKDRWMGSVLGTAREVMADSTPHGSSLLPMAEYHFSTGGKRLRALIPLVVAEALGVDPTRVVGLSAACEILHNATLVHDDLQDGDVTRRGEPTVWVKWGEARAINLGDAMLYWTLAALDRVQFDDAMKWQLAQQLVRDTLQVIDGQEREFLMQDAARPSVDDYVRMVTGKTSGLFALPMAGTAQLCGAPTQVVEGLREAATHLGVLFQLQDDVLDLYGDKGREMPGSDLGEGKVSSLVAWMFENGPAEQVTWLDGVLRADREELTSDDVTRAAAMFREHGALEWVLSEIERRHSLAIDDDRLQSNPALVRLVSGLAELFVAPIESVR